MPFDSRPWLPPKDYAKRNWTLTDPRLDGYLARWKIDRHLRGDVWYLIDRLDPSKTEVPIPRRMTRDFVLERYTDWCITTIQRRRQGRLPLHKELDPRSLVDLLRPLYKELVYDGRLELVVTKANGKVMFPTLKLDNEQSLRLLEATIEVEK